ncbi:helix-turn-helix domain-containing protein [Streptomyces sp. NPDC045456]|uniref:helix-turn-helix domain-containing protein n=1 Tax=Streptomyces sp. NPDC045456 TaxID=3155254 RepID=UPI0033F62801
MPGQRVGGADQYGDGHERAVATRRAILTAAAEVSIERGYGGASVSQITARAGVAAGAVYFHFRSKEGIAHSLLGLDLLEGLPPHRGPALQEWFDLALLGPPPRCRPKDRAASYLAALADSQGGWTSPWPAWRATAARPLHAAAGEGELQAHVRPDAVTEGCGRKGEQQGRAGSSLRRFRVSPGHV